MRVWCDFVDGNNVWRDAGNLRHNAKGFVLDLDKDNGNRVFPLKGRRVEVYTDDGTDDPMLVVEETGVTHCSCCAPYGKLGHIFNAGAWMRCPQCNPEIV